MQKEQVLGLVRHALTVIGGAAIANGYIEDGIAQEIVGVVLTIVGIVWSITSKKK
tara:strand:- start:7806 stop:7970 length:165 start_codon:yes stop_codon:yes gene_type:complete